MLSSVYLLVLEVLFVVSALWIISSAIEAGTLSTSPQQD
jgi:hypothetical protein